MKKTPSCLKGLAETRARAAGDALRLERLLNQIQEELESARERLQACDTLIKAFDERLDPNQIQPVSGWKGRYGAHGAFRQAILELIEESGQDGILTTELMLLLQQRFQIDFALPGEAERWRQNAVKPKLKKLVREGLVERVEDPLADKVASNATARWRRTDANAMTLEHLAADSEAQGVAVRVGRKR